MQLTDLEVNILNKLPMRIRVAVYHEISLHMGVLQEIRIRAKQHLTLTIQGRNILSKIICNVEDLEETLTNLCCNSLYSHSETIREGYICIEGGVRAGVCGRAVTEEGRITAIRDIFYICIRIPHRFPGAADDLFERISKNKFQDNILVYGKPGSGKTTLLRELILKMSEHHSSPQKLAVIDTRYELTVGIPVLGMVDILCGYPRHQGILSAIRTMAPDYVICDEIMTAEDALAIESCLGSGVHVCASVHSDSYHSLCKHKIFGQIMDSFGICYNASEIFMNEFKVADRLYNLDEESYDVI